MLSSPDVVVVSDEHQVLKDGQEVRLCGSVSYHVGQEVVNFAHVSALEVKEKHCHRKTTKPTRLKSDSL